MTRGEQLFEDQRVKRTGGKALERLDPKVCPECLGILDPETVGEQALFRHGGYGATRETTTLHCSGCGWSLVREITEARP